MYSHSNLSIHFMISTKYDNEETKDHDNNHYRILYEN